MFNFVATVIAFQVNASAIQVPRIQIPDEPSCASCRIVSTVAVRIGSASGPGSFDDAPVAVRVDGKSRYWVFSAKSPPRVFDPSGKFLRMAGRDGEGPGEYRAGGDMATLVGDSVAVFDARNGRVAIVAPDLQTVGTVPLPTQFRNPLGVGLRRVVASGYVRTTDSIRRPLHIVDLVPEGARVIRSVGPKNGDITFGTAEVQTSLGWHLAPAKDGGIWSEDLIRYRIIKWSKDEQEIVDLERQPEWFPQPLPMWLGNPSRPPNPRTGGVSEDASGLLWTFTQVPSPEWAKAWPANLPAGAKEAAGNAIDIPQLYETVVEAIDVSKNRVVARTRLNDYMVAVLSGGRAVFYRTTADGIPFVEVRRFAVAR